MPEFGDPVMKARHALERAHPGWRTGQARDDWILRHDLPVSAGWYYAQHVVMDVPAVTADRVDELDRLVADTDAGRLAIVVAQVAAFYPGWKVGLLGSKRPRRLRNIPAQNGQFYARLWAWDPAVGWAAGDLCDDIARILRDGTA